MVVNKFWEAFRPIASDALHVILVHFNPRRLQVRTRLFLETADRLERDGAVVWRVEAAFANRKHEVTDWWNPRHVQVRTSEEIWNKEALINLGASRLFARQPTAKFIAWLDADIQFVRPDWVQATKTELEHHQAVQLFSNAIDLNPKYDFMGRAHGFAKLWQEGQRPGDFEKNKHKYPSHMHPGYGWGFRVKTWKAIGGMMTFGVLGSGDAHMAAGMVGCGSATVWPGVSEGYRRAVEEWSKKANEVIQGDIGYVEGLVVHHFHGYKEHRGYKSRVDILRQYQFDPYKDLTFTPNGLPLIYGKTKFKREIAKYMGSRKEYDLTKALETPSKSNKNKKK